MNGEFHQYYFATFKSFGNTDIFVKPFFEFSVASGKLAASVKIYKIFAVFGFYKFKISGRYCKEYGTIAILVVLYFSRLNRVRMNFIFICERNPFVVEIVEYSFGVLFSQRELNFTYATVVHTAVLSKRHARLDDDQRNN